MNENEKEAVLICDKYDEETSASLRELFPDALCM